MKSLEQQRLEKYSHDKDKQDIEEQGIWIRLLNDRIAVWAFDDAKMSEILLEIHKIANDYYVKECDEFKRKYEDKADTDVFRHDGGDDGEQDREPTASDNVSAGSEQEDMGPTVGKDDSGRGPDEPREDSVHNPGDAGLGGT